MEKAKRATIQLGDRELDVFLLPDGSYWFSQTQIAQAVGLEEIYARRFLRSKWLKTLPGKGFTPDDLAKIEVESSTQTRGQTRISPIDLTTAALFWVYQVWQRNKSAVPLVTACIQEQLIRRADRAFGVERSEAEYAAVANELMAVVRDQDQVLKALEDNYATDDAARRTAEIAWTEVQRLQELLEENGINYRTE